MSDGSALNDPPSGSAQYGLLCERQLLHNDDGSFMEGYILGHGILGEVDIGGKAGIQFASDLLILVELFGLQWAKRIVIANARQLKEPECDDIEQVHKSHIVLDVPPPPADQDQSWSHLFLCHDCDNIADCSLGNQPVPVCRTHQVRVCGIAGCTNSPVMNTDNSCISPWPACPEWVKHPIDICNYHCAGGKDSDDFLSMVYYDTNVGQWRELPEELQAARFNAQLAQEELQRAHKKYKINLD